MSTCLYCGAQLNSRTAHFCRGHHRPYRANLINQWNSHEAGSPERGAAGRLLRRFPGWWDYENDAPVPFSHRSGNASVREEAPALVVRHYDPIQFRFRKFGVELETASASEKVLTDAINLIKASGVNMQTTSYNHNDVSYWKVLTDGSLSGGYCREIVSPPFATEAGYLEVQQVASVLTTMGVKVNNSCGFHCHLDASDLTPKQIARIVKFYQVYETEIDKLHQASRRGNPQYTGTLNSRYYADFDPERVNSISDLTNMFGTRYLKVNVQAFLRHGTIEFRQHGATVDPFKIVNWVKFCTRIVEYAKTDRPIDVSVPLFEALNLSEAEKLYWNHRKEVLRAA